MFDENIQESGITQGFTDTPESEGVLPVLSRYEGSAEDTIETPDRFEGLKTPRVSTDPLLDRDYDYDTGILDAVGSAANQWGTKKLVEGVAEGTRLGRDLYTLWEQQGVKGLATGIVAASLLDNINMFGDDDPNFNLTDALTSAGIKLTKEEHEYMVQKLPQNQRAFEYLIENRIKIGREDAKATAKYGATAFVTGMADPVYLAVGGLGGVAGRTLNMGRMGSVAASVGLDTATLAAESYYNPYITDMDFAANAILGGTLGMVLGQPKPKGKIEAPELDSGALAPAVPQVDGGALNDVIAALQRGDADWQVHVDKYADVEFGTIPREGMGTTFGNSHINATPEVEFTMVDGKPQYKFTGEMEIDTPTASADVRGVRGEYRDVEAGGYANYNNWAFVKKTDEPTLKDNVPRYEDIDWSYRNKEGIELKDSALHAVYKIADSNLDPVIKSQAQRMIALGGEKLSNTAYKYTEVKRVDPSKNYAGAYHLSSNMMEVRKMPPLYNIDPNQTTMHEAMHVLTSAKLIYGERNPNSVHGKLYREVEALRKHLVKEMKEGSGKEKYDKLKPHEKALADYAVSNTRELFAHVAEITGDKNKFLRDFLDNTPVPSTLKTDPFSRIFNMTQALVDNLRKLFGMNIKEGNALARTFGLQDDVLRAPEIATTIENGRVKYTQIGDTKGVYDAAIVEADTITKALSQVNPEGIGKFLAWNLYKTVAKVSPNFSNKWLNDPLGTNGGNIQQIKNAIRTDLIDKYRTNWERLALDELKVRNIRMIDMVFKPAKVRKAQNAISKEVSEAMIQIERGTYNPDLLGLSPNVRKIVDTMNDFGKDVAKQLVEHNLLPKEVLEGNGGYFVRRWDGNTIDTVISKLEGMVETGIHADKRTAAVNYLGAQMAKTFRFEGVDVKTKNMYGVALIRRALNQAEGTDLVFRGHMGNDIAYKIRNDLMDLGVDTKDINRLLDVVTGKIDQAGKQRWQKSRMDLDMGAELCMPDGSYMRVADLMDTSNIFQTMPRYLDEVAGHMAMAQHGIVTTVDLDKAKDAFVKDAKKHMTVPQAQTLFDDIHANTLGRATGREVHVAARVMSGLTQMVALRNSGFWQVTELAKAYMRGLTTAGFMETNRMMGRAFGQWREVGDPTTARQLNHILSRKSFNEVRMRPYVDRFEDGFASRSNFMSGMQHAQGLVYHVNGMSSVQRLQANFAANVLTANLERAVKGDTKLREYFKRLGMEDSVFNAVGKEMDKHGLFVDKWDHNVWAKVNPVLTSIMDTDVLKASLGDIPAFFQFSETGKVLGTFMNFTLSAQNRILANTLYNDGAKAFALMTTLQIPLAMLATQAASVSAGRGLIEDNGKWSAAVMGQMGSFGALTELFNIISGNSKGFGGAMTISVDRASDVFGKTARGEFGEAAEAAAKSAPLISLFPAWGLGVETLMGGDE